MLVVIKVILYEGAVALRASVNIGKIWEDLSLEVTADGLGGREDRGDRTRQDPRYDREKTYRRDLLYERPRNSSWH